VLLGCARPRAALRAAPASSASRRLSISCCRRRALLCCPRAHHLVADNNITPLRNDQDLAWEMTNIVADLIRPALGSSTHRPASASSMLPLHFFCDRAATSKQSEQLLLDIAASRAELPIKAAACVDSANRTDQWSMCQVTGYDSATEEFDVEWDSQAGMPNKLHRICCCCEGDDLHQFARAFAVAYDLRKQAERLMRYNLFIDCMPAEEVPAMDKDQVSRIISLAYANPKLGQGGNASYIIEEVALDFTTCMNKLVFDANQQADAPDEGPSEAPRLPPQYGVVQIPSHDMAGMFDQISAKSPYLTSEGAIQAMAAVTHLNDKMLESVHIFDTKRGDPVSLDDFVLRQGTARRTAQSGLEYEWITKIGGEIKRHLGEEAHAGYNLHEADRAKYESTRLFPLLGRVNMMTADTLRFLSHTSFADYTEFIVSTCAAEFEVNSTNDITATYVVDVDKETQPDAWLQAQVSCATQQPAPLFSFSLCVSSEKTVINQTEISDAEARIAAWITEHTVDGELTTDEPCPISPVEAVEGLTFEYDTDCSVALQQVLTTFVQGIQMTGDVGTVEIALMDRLYWPVKPALPSVDENEEWVVALIKRVTDATSAASNPLQAYRLAFAPFAMFLNLDVEEYLKEVTAKTYIEEKEVLEDDDDEEPAIRVTIKLTELETIIKGHQLQQQEVHDAIPAEPVKLGLFSVSASAMRALLADKHAEIIDRLLEELKSQCSLLAQTMVAKYEDIFRRLGLVPKDIEQLTKLTTFMESVPDLLEPQAADMKKMDSWIGVLGNFTCKLDMEQSNRIWTCMGWPKQIYEKIEDAEATIEERKIKYAQAMMMEQEAFDHSLIQLEAEAESFAEYSDIGQVEQVAAHVKTFTEKMDKAIADAMLFNTREELFEKDPTDYEVIQRIKETFEPYSNLWSTANSWLKHHQEWTENQFTDLNAEQLEQDVENAHVTIVKALKYFKSTNSEACYQIAKDIKDQVVEFKPNVPVIVALRNPGLRDRHWEDLSKTLGFQLNPSSDDLTLDNVLELNLTDQLDMITKVSEAAAKEYQIQSALDSMEGQWDGFDLDIIPYKETGTSILKGIDEIFAVLDEHITMTQAMQFSAFKKPFEERIENWDKSLAMVAEVLDEWLAVQRNWLYLQPIFESPDINKQLPTEGKRFASVDKSWRQTLASATAKPNTMKFCNNQKLLERFQEGNAHLDQVQKGLSDYLETKRGCFGRFFFLSNDELLSILSESKDVELVQPHLKKCFEGINRVVFEDDLKISSFISGDKEQVPTFAMIDPKEKGVEVWMLELENMMKATIRDHMYRGVLDYMKIKRTTWMQKWPAMCVLNGSQLHWTKNMEDSLTAKGKEGVQVEMDRQLAQLSDMVILVRGKLDDAARNAVGALTVLDVHARDVTIKMLTEGVETANDFIWSSQLRYYWLLAEGDIGDPIVADGDLYAQMVVARRPYGYEYLGNSFRLVITPLTDKCYLTIMGALQMILGGAPAGPAGTGKTETTKDLAKALAKQCVVFNCSDGLDYIAMGKFFKGLASCGAWACFDEFNRIDIEVLSVVGQQVASLQNGIKQGKPRILFEDSDIILNPQFGVFITMNPGYAGRSDLPDSLAALFRPVAMMVPDYALIGEIMFFAYGFAEAKLCGAKMVTTFKLCSEQLSSQSHYDYGMRAVKTVITAAGNLKRVDPDMDEEVLLLRALQDVNLPKFLAHDLPLFAGIISDLFPGKKRPDIDLGVLIQCVKLSTAQLNLQPHPFFLTKIIQLYETICVRHGLMVVGPTGGAKTSNISVLSRALAMLKSWGEEGVRYEAVDKYQLNPKSITMGQLYGEFDANTHEWQDGILSTLYRIAANDPAPCSKWVIFDGPVDAIWIENMNTVLDDNKKLCLNSGEMLQMSDTMTMMFEVEDLSVASPATVSRCGMVYMEPRALGNDPLVTSWLETLPELVPMDARLKLRHLFDIYLEAALFFLRMFLKELAPTVNNNLVNSVTNILDCNMAKFIVKEDVDPPTEEELAEIVVLAEPWFVFALIWSVGATCNGEGREKFDAWLRSELASNETQFRFPNEGFVYDYTLDTSKGIDKVKWVKWMDTIPTFVADAKLEFSEIVVPTMDSVRNTYLLETLLTNNKHVLMVGDTGTGKTINIERYLGSMADVYIPLTMTFSAQTSANQVQDTLDSKMEKRRKGIFGPVAGKQYVIYVDDLNMPKRETYFAQPPIEILRQWFDQGGWYDRKALIYRKIVDILFVSSMGPPGGGRNPVTPRFLRHFNVIGYSEMSDESKVLIFSTILSSFLTSFTPEVQQQTEPLCNATISVYNTISADLLPTPAKSHYLFNLRDLAKVFQGVLMAPVKKVVEGVQLIRMWVHECTRVFQDRMVNQEDKLWFRSLMDQKLGRYFKTKYDTVVTCERLVYGDFMEMGSDAKIYEEIDDMGAMKSVVDEYLNNHNAESKQPMPLVMFLDAIEHVARVSRVIRQPQGNMLLLGVGGSGRQSMTRLATYIAGFKSFQVEITKGYGVYEWREDLKTCLLQAGVKEQPTVFLFSDVQIVNEQMLEDINNVLNAGDVPNLYQPEDLDAIATSCRGECVKKKIPPTKMNIFTQYIVRVRRFIHVCLCMSPVGETFRDRLRMFPSLVNCCTIDWFSEWPAEALNSVATAILTKTDLKLGENLKGLVEMVKVVHQSAERKSADFYEMLRRRNYVTPTSYLELLSTFTAVLQSKRDEVMTTISRLQNGVDKIAETKGLVDGMQTELVELQPILTKTQTEVDAMMIQIKKDKADADVTKEIVQKEEASANIKAAATKEIADDAQRDLDEALPALDAAVQCLNRLKKSDLDDVKNFKSPPGGVKVTMAAVCILFGLKPVKKQDPDNPAKKIEDYWETANKQILPDPKKFMDDLLNFDKDNIPSSIIAKFKPYYEDEEYTPARIEKASKACTAICMWTRAMYIYHEVALQVEPKKAALAGAQAELDVTLAQLAEAQGKLKAVLDRLAELEKGYNDSVAKKEALATQVKTCEIQLSNAAKLIGSLGEGEARWIATVKKLNVEYGNLVGDVVVTAGTIGYLGAFTAEFRQEMVAEWREGLVTVKMPHSPGCDITDTLNEPVKQRSWQIAGLPTDSVSTQNGIIMARSRRWSLCIDPQGQANRFLQNYGKDVAECENGLDVIKLTDKNYLRTLENGVRFGKWVLLENIAESLDATLEPVLLQQKFKQGGTEMMKLGDNTVPYHDSFRFFITTKMANPHYAPEVCVKVTLLNFSITMSGLEEQLLVVSVQEELPELAEKKNELTINNARMKKELYDIESQILYLLSNSTGNILDDTNLIETLAQAKVTSEEVTTSLNIAEQTEKEINITSNNYRPVAYRAALLFFCIADMAKVDSMYQYSLPWFTNLFINGIANADNSPEMEQRLENLNTYFTYLMYKNVCRSLFERHKLLFSFLLAIKILQGDDKIDGDEWRFLIAGSCGTATIDEPNPDSHWVEPRAWAEICSVSTLPAFSGFATDFKNELSNWREMFDSTEPHNFKFPGKWESDLHSLQKMCILRALRPDKVTESIQNYVCEHLSEKFIQPPPFDLPGTYEDSDAVTPLIFILSTGSDPAKDLLLFAADQGMDEDLASIALGQGQGPIAQRMIENGVEKGSWVLLQNCHLAKSWMPELARICEEFDADKVKESFRLWLTSLPSPHFPTAVLQNGVKMTKEPPKGIRANLNQTYLKMDDERLSRTSKPGAYRKLLFGLSFFHASIVERKKFGPLGWNIGYAFNETDLDISMSQLELFLDSFDTIEYSVLCHMTSVVNYGGRVTDDKDMRTSDVILSSFFNPDILTDDYMFSKSGTYFSIPSDPDTPHQSYMDYITSLPINPDPEVFGMHDNANISCAQAETYGNFEIIASLQPRIAAGAGKSREDIIGEACADIEARLPLNFSIEMIQMSYPVTYNESMNTVLVQELEKFNRLLVVLKRSLASLQLALKGLVVMSGELEAMSNFMYNQKVPQDWENVAYPSLKPLMSWVSDLLARLTFYTNWVVDGIPATYWVSAFFFPQAFTTGTLQNYARKMQMPIDTVSNDHLFKDEKPEELKKPEDGAYIYGLFCEGARWDMKMHGLDDPNPKELFSEIPVIHLAPVQHREITTDGIYRCPVYKVLTRTGLLSTTGHSTNFVFWLEVPSDRPTIYRQSLVSETNANIKLCDQAYWVNGGVACFCGLRF
jgi:dynein heavy chain